ncbi:MAG: hypothetical protein PVI90_00065 [Desulfobacteraceae bacterium]|jgi:pyruvate/2-oxoglutarate dehydrogenase complex dihydrolipoamide acyltransferase (E2) component
MFYDKGIKIACIQVGLEKYALNLSHLVKQLRHSYQASPVARAELQRIMGGAGVGAVAGGIGGGIGGSAVGKTVPAEQSKLDKLLGREPAEPTGGHPVSGALLGALLGGVGGAFGGRSLGRLQEGRIAKTLSKRKDIPFGQRSHLKRKAQESVIPRMPKLPKVPTPAKAAPAAAPKTAPTATPATPAAAAAAPAKAAPTPAPTNPLEGFYVPSEQGLPPGVTNLSPKMIQIAKEMGML